MRAEMTDFARVTRSSKRRPARTRTVSTRVTEAEYIALQEQAWSSGKTVCDWARACITQQLGQGSQKILDAHIFTELVGIQLLLMNTLGPIARGERMAAEQVDVVFREVQTRKARKAQELLNKRLGRELESRGGTQTQSVRTAIS
jgi:Mobilization protein NikA